MFTLSDFVNNVRTDMDRDGIGRATVENVNVGEYSSESGGFDPGLMRPYLADNGQVYVDVTKGYAQVKNSDGGIVRNVDGSPRMRRVVEPQRVIDRLRRDEPVLHVNNASALRKDQWIKIDTMVAQAARKRMRAYADLRARVPLSGFDAMSTPILERELIDDPGEAVVDMDGISEARNFAERYDLQGMPLPITHSDFFMSKRFLQITRTRNTPADNTRISIAGRRVGEAIEQTTIGTISGITYGDSTDYLQTSSVYGYLTHPATISYTSLIASATMASNIATTGGTSFVQDIIDMIGYAYANNMFGPFVLYVSTAYDNLLSNDFKAESDKTIRSRVLEIDGISDVRRLDYLTSDKVLLVQMDTDTVQAVNGMEVTTVQWDTKGGMQLNFKVMAIQVPYIKSRYLGPTTSGRSEVTGIVVGSTS